jgi:large repetitive protein
MRPWMNVVLLAFLASTCGTTSTGPSQTRFTLSGAVRASAGSQPLAGVHVTLVDGAVTRGIDTNAEGRYEFPDLLAGTFELQFSKDGYSSTQRTVSLTADVVLDVTLDVALPPRYTLSGTVRTPWNELLGDVGVEAVADGRVRGGSTTTSSGAYNMPGLAPTDYVVRVRRWSYYAADVAVHLTSDTRLDFVMDRAKRALHGTVEESPPCVAKPVGGATLHVLDGPDAGMSAITSSLGEYDFQPLRWGTVVLQISKPGYVTAQTTVEMPQSGGGDGTGVWPLFADFRLTPTNGTCGTTP